MEAAGLAIIHTRGQQVQVALTLSEPFNNLTVVTLNTKNGQFVQDAYKDLDVNGFTAVLAQPAAWNQNTQWDKINYP